MLRLYDVLRIGSAKCEQGIDSFQPLIREQELGHIPIRVQPGFLA